MSISKNDVIAENRYLSAAEMAVNAEYIWNKLTAAGWSKNSVAAILGNMETESTINPAIWENLTPEPSNGFGLVQWTPSTKYSIWADANGYLYTDIDGQLARLQYELDNGLQWITTESYPMTFAHFKVSTDSPETLAQAFLLNYERPADQNQPARSTQARKWFTRFAGGSPVVKTQKGLSKLLLYGTVIRRNVVR